MPIGLVAASLIGTAAGAGTSIFGAVKASGTAKKVSKQQADAAKEEGRLRLDASNQANRVLGEQFNLANAGLNPYAQTGLAANNTLMQWAQPGQAAGSNPLAAPTPFQAPTGADQQNDPGYQFRLDQGLKALQGSAAAKGTLLTGGTGKSLQEFGQNYASNEYGNVYARARDQYDLAQRGLADQFNRISGMAGSGANIQGSLANLGMQYANNYGQNLGTGAAAQGNAVTGAANALGAGQVAGTNAWNSALQGIGLNLQQIAQMQALGLFKNAGAPGTAGVNASYTGE